MFPVEARTYNLSKGPRPSFRDRRCLRNLSGVDWGILAAPADIPTKPATNFNPSRDHPTNWLLSNFSQFGGEADFGKSPGRSGTQPISSFGLIGL